MSRWPALSLGIALGVWLLALAWSAHRLVLAKSLRSSAQARLVSLVADAQELVNLRAGDAPISAGQRPDQDVIAQVTAALAQAGLPGDRLKDLAQESDHAIRAAPGAGPAYREQAVRLTIEPVSPRELGEFLNAWRSSQRVWTVRQVELTHAGKDDDPAFRAVLQIAALYIGEHGMTADSSDKEAP